MDREGEVGVGLEWNGNLGRPRGTEGGGVDFTWGWWLHREKRRRGRYEFRTGIGTVGYLWLMTPPPLRRAVAAVLILALSPSEQRGSLGTMSLPDLYRIKYNC